MSKIYICFVLSEEIIMQYTYVCLYSQMIYNSRKVKNHSVMPG